MNGRMVTVMMLALALMLMLLPARAEDSTLYVKKVENLPEDFIFGMDVSSVIAEENSGVKYYDFKGNEADLFRVPVQIRHMIQQHTQGGDILGIMLQDIIQQLYLLCFQIGKIPLRHFAAGQVVLPGFSQDHFLQPAQIAPAQPQLPDSPAHMQKVQMGYVQAFPAHPVHQKPALQQGHIEGRAVEGAQHIKFPQSRRHMLQQIRFLRIIPHQKLMYFKSLIRQIPHSHQKSNRTAASQTGGFRIQIQDLTGIEMLRYFPVAHHAQGFPVQVISSGEILRWPVYRKMAAIGRRFRLWPVLTR